MQRAGTANRAVEGRRVYEVWLDSMGSSPIRGLPERQRTPNWPRP